MFFYFFPFVAFSFIECTMQFFLNVLDIHSLLLHLKMNIYFVQHLHIHLMHVILQNLILILESVSTQNKSLFIVAEDIDGEALATLIVNKMTSYRDWETDRKSTRLNSSHSAKSRMPSSA